MNTDMLTDRRHNMLDEDDNSWYVTTTARNEPVAGPFGSHEYATVVRDRIDGDYPGTAHVVAEQPEVEA